ncbi:MAG: GTP-binding protein [Promethearchaeota archaeon]|nr:MAG: GTP-binding protein [Candidatus Lokiarchaeota archaeon]
MERIYKLKMVIGGAAGSGKSSFLTGKPSINLEFNNLGVSFKPIECIINNGDSYQFICWDPNVKERYRFLFPVFCRGVSCAILCFDLSDHTSFEELPYWIKTVRKNGIIDTFKIPIVLVGTKKDLNIRAVSENEVDNLIDQFDLDGIFYSSIYEKNFKQIKEAIFKILIEKIEPYYQIEDFSIYIPREDNEFKDFLRTFSVCPICGNTNHYDSLKNFYYSRDPSLKKLKEKLLDLMEESKDFDDVYYNEINIGIPCCKCFEEQFGNK